ncbi:MAG: hypothetical protein ACI915_001955 [Gammaproteobacteria bacterium]|jgi:hypothetical protein
MMNSLNTSVPGEPARVAEFFKALDDDSRRVTVRTIELQGDQPPWQSSGLHVRQGQAYSLFAEGTIHWSERYPHLHGGPQFHLWARIHSQQPAQGRAVNLSADSGTFVADIDGDLELGIYMGMWADEFGRLKSGAHLYEALRGAISVAIVVYDSDAGKSLQWASSIDSAPAMVTAETQRHLRGDSPPSGWHYLHEAGYSSLYQKQTTVGGDIICAHANNDQGILRRAVDFPLVDSTEIQWRWRVDEHPSCDREDLAISHDYVSVAVEFDDGRDLSWIWSSCLEPELFFQCPVKIWKERETHFVVRSKDDKLATWTEETRNVFADVSKSMGSPPHRITALWLIVLSTFNHRTARASFADILLTNGDQRIRVL